MFRCAMNYFVVLASLLLGCLVPVHADEVQINGKECGMFTTRTLIANGTVAKEDQFPWTVFLKIRTADRHLHICGGSIFTKRHVLTAAHCITYDSGDPIGILVIYGNNDWRSGRTLRVTKMIRHPMYKGKPFAHDIAVLTVEKPFKFTGNVKPICIPAVPMDIYNTDTVVAGWGHVKEGTSNFPHRLRYTTVKILPNERCSSVYPGYDKNVMYCAYRKGAGFCDGDSGGPLMAQGVGARYVQVGIVSNAGGCAKLNKPGVYTRVDAFTPWLMQVVRSSSSSDKAYSEEVPLQLAPYMVPQWPFFNVPLWSYNPFFTSPIN